MYIEIIPHGSKKYISSAWDLKQEINNKSNLLRQDWGLFKYVYKNSKVYISKMPDDSLIGYACLIDEYYLSLLAIHIDHQRKGVGRSLIKEIKKDYDYFYCHARKSNQSAYQFYMDMNLDEICIEKDYYDCGDDAYKLKYINENSKYTD